MQKEAGLARDIAVTRAVREAFPDCGILVDGNDCFTCDDFLYYFDRVADCGLYWIEEPFPETREDYLRLKEQVVKKSPSTLLADGEARPDVEQLLGLGREGLLDIICMDIESYGFTGWRKTLPLIASTGLRASPHCYGSMLKTCYTAHLAIATGQFPTLEGLPGETEGVSTYQLRDGLLYVSEHPGFGLDLQWAPEMRAD
jgi:L-alanine-DL-glutamate epimerase-like enolase superfamily enzyme